MTPTLPGSARRRALGELGLAAAAAGESLLRAAQTGESNVRERAIQAIRQIRPSEEIYATPQDVEIDPDLIAALRAIEQQSEVASPLAEVDIIPVVVAPLIDPETGQPIQFAVTLVEQPSCSGSMAHPLSNWPKMSIPSQIASRRFGNGVRDRLRLRIPQPEFVDNIRASSYIGNIRECSYDDC